MENWIIPCNVKVFDVITHFKTSKTVIWKNAFTIKEGDTAYIYIGSPYSQIKYKCCVISDKVDDEELSQNQYAIPAKQSKNYFSKKEKYVKLEFEKEYPDNLLTLEVLKKNGLGQVQIQARTDRRLQRYIDEMENSMGGAN